MRADQPLVRIALVAIGVLSLFSLSLILGTHTLSPATVWHALIHPDMQNSSSQIIWNLRLPRSLLAVLVGIHFALSGLILQAVLRNPLADPGVIGISSGASLAVIIMLMTGGSMLASPVAMPVAALLGGTLACALVIALAWRAQLNPVLVALYGVALAASLNALVMWVVVSHGHGQTELAVLWLAGTLYGRDFDQLLLILPWTLVCLLILPWLLKPLTLMRFNDAIATGCGLDLKRWRLLALLLAVALAASAVAVSGPIGFVGLIVPHLAALLTNRYSRSYIPLTILLGAALLLTADLIGRILLPPLELPAGAISALIGVPVFIYVIQRMGALTR